MTTPTRRGRPRIDPLDESVPIHLHLPAKLYAKTFTEARRARQSVNDWIRDQIREAMTRRDAAGRPIRLR